VRKRKRTVKSRKGEQSLGPLSEEWVEKKVQSKEEKKKNLLEDCGGTVGSGERPSSLLMTRSSGKDARSQGNIYRFTGSMKNRSIMENGQGKDEHPLAELAKVGWGSSPWRRGRSSSVMMGVGGESRRVWGEFEPRLLQKEDHGKNMGAIRTRKKRHKICTSSSVSECRVRPSWESRWT